MDRFQGKEAEMKKCDVCGHTSFHRDQVEEVFHVGDRLLMVENIPAEVCDRCGEATFDRDTVERIRSMVHENGRPQKSVSVSVYAYS
jgi:YgiT-type zinc finger domain-containing protein